jgi:hypothetical protein
LNRFRVSPPVFDVNRRFAAFRTTALLSGASGERLMTLRLPGPNSHGFLFTPPRSAGVTRPKPIPLAGLH